MITYPPFPPFLVSGRPGAAAVRGGQYRDVRGAGPLPPEPAAVAVQPAALAALQRARAAVTLRARLWYVNMNSMSMV